ncbi:TatD family hydrolase [Vibrio sp. S4M6]|uniref:TatD family hydrolase n=1 Tax=Vibrio sinus TaxID=2946865 RepID=UPI00202A0B6A|nr:TatD family hydrolase [Vibrio sinus]MCL9781451.1 TatD family hydrolase [Vibrio sinus]
MSINSRYQLFDTHCHIDFSQFENDFSNCLLQAESNYVTRFLIPSIGQQNWQRIQSISMANPNIFHAFGFHPYFLVEYSKEAISSLETALTNRHSQCVAVGECGLDSAIDIDIKTQEKYLQAQLSIAQNLQLPVILHSRKTHNRLLQLIKKFNISVGGVLHGFSGSYEQAMAFVDKGFKIGVGGTITYPRAMKTRKAVSQLSLQHIVLETDSPDMPIYGFQGQTNYPHHLPKVLQQLSLLKDQSEESIAISIWENSNHLFNICV